MIKIDVYKSQETCIYGKKATFEEGREYWFKESRHCKVVGFSEERRWVGMYPRKMTSHSNPLEKGFDYVKTFYVQNKKELNRLTKEKNH